MPQDMSPRHFQKSTEWIKKWVELITKTKNSQMEESGGLIQWADGSWCQFVLFWSAELKPLLQPSPEQVTFDPRDRHNTDNLYSFSFSACFPCLYLLPSLKLCTSGQVINIKLCTAECNGRRACCWLWGALVSCLKKKQTNKKNYTFKLWMHSWPQVTFKAVNYHPEVIPSCQTCVALRFLKPMGKSTNVMYNKEKHSFDLQIEYWTFSHCSLSNYNELLSLLEASEDRRMCSTPLLKPKAC